MLALCLTLELEENGTWRVRDHPGQILTGPPKPEQPATTKQGTEGEKKEGEETKEEGKVEVVGTVDRVADKMEDLKVDGEEPEAPVASTSNVPVSESSETLRKPSTSTLEPTAPSFSPAASSSSSSALPVPSTSTSDDSPDPQSAPSTSECTPLDASIERDEPVEDDDAEENDSDSESEGESDDSSGSWITPSNIHAHKVKDLGLFSAPSTSKTAQPKPKTILKAAVLTGDFAMQNVGLQMGLNVLGSGGKRVKEVRTWVLRCHACFK